VVTAVSTTAAHNSSFDVGGIAPVTVTFSSPVDVTGTPLLALNSGGTASYSSGSGTDTLTFTYTVAAGQNANPLDYSSTTALTLNGGTIKDASMTSADLSLPAPGSAGDDLFAANIRIDTTSRPSVSLASQSGGMYDYQLDTGAD
jgi:large repetitive protein